jgi:chemotaxis signal transduction protein
MSAHPQPQVLLFDVGGLRMGVLLAEVSRLLIEGELLAIPEAHAALAGVLDDAAEDLTLPVFDLQAFLWPERGNAAEHATSTVAAFATGLGQAGIRLSRQLGTRDHYTRPTAEEAEKLAAQVPEHAQVAFSVIAQADDGAFVLFQPDNFWLKLDLLAPAKPSASSS